MRGARVAVVAAVLIGVAVGLGAFTFVYAKGASYLTTDPAACANCHVMEEHFDAWQHSSHRAVAGCADCHMPYERRGAMKISDHHVRSPLLNIDNACQICHKVSEEELRRRVYTIQDRTFEMRNIAIDALLQLVDGIAQARGADSASPRVAAAQRYQRAAQFFADFVEAENSMGFHADQEAVRILGNSINFSRFGSAALRGESMPAAPLDAVRASARRPAHAGDAAASPAAGSR